MANLDKDEVVAAFTEAYKKANGKAPSIESKSGWYSVDGGKKRPFSTASRNDSVVSFWLF